MFEIESKGPNKVKVGMKNGGVVFDVAEYSIDAGLEVGKIKGPGEFEIGEIAISGIATDSGRTVYAGEISGVRIGFLGDTEEGLDDLGVIDILCTSSLRSVREIAPKLVVATGNAEKMADELKLPLRREKKLKIKNLEALADKGEIVVLE